jgi:hypothetical protein
VTLFSSPQALLFFFPHRKPLTSEAFCDSRSDRFAPEYFVSNIHLMGQMDPRDGRDAVNKGTAFTVDGD